MNNKAEEMLHLILKRQSVRKYRQTPVPRSSLERCVEAARMAPSANNGQPWTFIVVGDIETKARLARAARFGLLGQNPFAVQAPVIVAVVESPGDRLTTAGGRLLRRYFPLMDIGMAVENFCIQAAAEGLGTCILGLFVAGEVRRALKIPNGHRIRLLITLGIPESDETRIKKRRPKESMSRYIEGRGIKNGS